MDKSLFEPAKVVDRVGALAGQLGSTLGLGGQSQENVHAFSILARILKDPEFHGIRQTEGETASHSSTLKKYAAEWSLDLSVPGEVERKIEEIVWMNSVIYGVGGWSKGQDYNADFILWVENFVH